MELKFFRILKADPLGDPWTPSVAGAKPIQGFWCQFAGVEHPVKVNKQVPNTPSLTEGQFGYLLEKTSAKGNSYYEFKGQKIPEGMSAPRYDGGEATAAPVAPAPTPHASDQKDVPYWFAPYAMMIKFIYDEMKGVSPDTPITQTQVLDEAKKSEESAEPDNDLGITKDELENIFGGKMSDPVELDK